MRRGWIVLIMLALASLACNLPSAGDSDTPASTPLGSDVNDGTTPTIVIESPPNGSQSYIGGKVDVRVRATDSIGVTRVEMRQAGRIVVSQSSPDPSTDFTALLTYKPTTIGSITLEVVAYRRTIASPSTTLSLTVVNTLNDLDAPLDPTTGVSAGTACIASVRVNNLNMRTGPSTNYNVLTKLGVGEVLTVIGRNEATTWYQVKRTNGGTGWVSAEYVETNGDCSRATVVSPP